MRARRGFGEPGVYNTRVCVGMCDRVYMGVICKERGASVYISEEIGDAGARGFFGGWGYRIGKENENFSL